MDSGLTGTAVRRHAWWGNECVFPFRRVMQCLWLIPCLKVNAYFMNVDFPADPNNHLRITGACVAALLQVRRKLCAIAPEITVT